MQATQPVLLAFRRYILESKAHAKELQGLVRALPSETLHVRVQVWRLFLGIFDIQANAAHKIAQLRKLREEYYAKKGKSSAPLCTPSETPTAPPKKLGPLGVTTPSTQSTPKPGFLEERLLREQIIKDVDRTYQQTTFFRQQSTKKLMQAILLEWCRASPLAYKQGMNQILAAVVHVYFQEIYQGMDQLYAEFISKEHAEADLFWLFDALMRTGHDKMFAFELEGKKGDLNPNAKNQQPILQRIARMQDHEFKLLDLQLFRYIKLQEVQMRPFLLRWIRCIHTREFPLVRALLLWDNILLEHSMNPQGGLAFLDCTCLALLSYLRERVLATDQSFQILQLYQQYPALSMDQLREVVSLAWSFSQMLKADPSAEVLTVQKKSLFLFEKGFAAKQPKLKDVKVNEVQEQQQFHFLTKDKKTAPQPQLAKAKEVIPALGRLDEVAPAPVKPEEADTQATQPVEARLTQEVKAVPIMTVKPMANLAPPSTKPTRKIALPQPQLIRLRELLGQAAQKHPESEELEAALELVQSLQQQHRK